MYLKCRHVMSGPGPSEELVEIATVGGNAELIVDSDLIQDEMLHIGAVVRKQNGHALIELPREALSGQSRVWVNSIDLKECAIA